VETRRIRKSLETLTEAIDASHDNFRNWCDHTIIVLSPLLLMLLAGMSHKQL
jgi:hypothetical protein